MIPSTRNAFANSPSREKSPVLTSKTKNEPSAIRVSEQRSAFPTLMLTYFLMMSATMSVPPDEPRRKKIMAEPIDVSSIAHTSSRKGSSVSGAFRGNRISKSFVSPEKSREQKTVRIPVLLPRKINPSRRGSPTRIVRATNGSRS